MGRLVDLSSLKQEEISASLMEMALDQNSEDLSEAKAFLATYKLLACSSAINYLANNVFSYLLKGGELIIATQSIHKVIVVSGTLIVRVLSKIGCKALLHK